MKLPKAEQNLDEWETAVECLICAAEGRDFLMHARVGMLRAINRNVERVFNPDRKRPKLEKAEAQEGRMTDQQILIRNNRTGRRRRRRIPETRELGSIPNKRSTTPLQC
jgi:hypothetical protein